VRKGILTPKRTPNREVSRELIREEPKEECRWEESENILRRIEGDTAQEDSSKDTRHLLVEIEELKQKLWEKDCLLETIGQRSNHILESHGSQTDDVSQKIWEKDALLDRTPSWKSKGTEGNDSQGGAFELDCQPGNTEDKNDKSEDMKLLQAQIDKLRQELAEKDRFVQSAQVELREQQVLDSPMHICIFFLQLTEEWLILKLEMSDLGLLLIPLIFIWLYYAHIC